MDNLKKQCKIPKVKLYWSDLVPMEKGTYAGMPIPPSYNIDTDTYGNNGYIYGGLVGFIPKLAPPTRNTYLNDGNSLMNANFNNVLQNYEDAPYFDMSPSVRDFKNSMEIKVHYWNWQVENLNGGKGMFTASTRKNKILEDELDRLLTEKYNSVRYMIAEVQGVNGGIVRTWATIKNVRPFTNSAHAMVDFELFDLADFYTKATAEEGQTSKDQSSGDVSKENDLKGGVPTKHNYFANVNKIIRYVQENRTLFCNPGGSQPITEANIRKAVDKVMNEFLIGNDKEQIDITTYGIGFQAFGEYNKFNLHNQAIPPLVEKGQGDTLYTYRMYGTARDTMANYFLFHMRERSHFNGTEVQSGTGRFDERYPTEYSWLDSQIKNIGQGSYLVDVSNIPDEPTGFKLFTTKATEFGTGLDELLNVFGIERVNWTMELRQVAGQTRAVLVPNLDVNFYRKNQSEISNVEFSINREDHIDYAVAYRISPKESDGNPEYHDATEDKDKDFPNDMLFYGNGGFAPNNETVALQTGFAVAHANKLNNATNEKFDGKTNDLQSQIDEIKANCCNDNPPPPPPPPPIDGEWYHPYGKNVAITQEFECATWNGAPYPNCFGCTHWHNGMDFSAGYGAALYAAQNGQITRASDIGDGFGNTVLLLIPGLEGLDTIVRYSHLSSIDVSVGQNVVQGQKIGAEGNTGFSTSSHLHLGVYSLQNGEINADSFCSASNPREYPFGGFGTGQKDATTRSTSPILEQKIIDNEPILKASTKSVVVEGSDNAVGQWEFWNDVNYGKEIYIDGGFDGTGSGMNSVFINTTDKLRKEAIDRIANIPRKAPLRIKFDINEYNDELPVFDIKPGDTIYVDILVCGKEYDVEKVVKSAEVTFENGAWKYSLDYY